jgi:hypothetical protein
MRREKMHANKLRKLLLVAVATTGLLGCGPDDGGSGSADDSLSALARGGNKDKIKFPSPAPSPSPSATSSTDAVVEDPATGTMQLAAIDDGLTESNYLTAVPLASSGAPDVVGAFRFLCPPSHISYDDPIVHPGQPGANEHLHIFFGNTGTNASSTFQSLRTSGDSTCRNMLNRSAYWQPAMLGKNTAGQDVVIVEDYTNFYYKRRPASDPAAEGIPVALPRGLKFVFGGMERPARFKCISDDRNVTDWLPTLQQALSLCAAGQQIDMAQSTPECWDGKNLDSADHRSHLTFLLRDKNSGKEFCPSTHPYLLPRLTFQRIFTIRSDDVTTTWRLSSDMPGDEPGSMAHADYIMAWNEDVHARWMGACINKLLTCSDGNLGDGAKLAANDLYRNAMASPGRRVPVPKRGEVISLLLR